MVGDIWRKIGPCPVRFFHRPVHVVAMLGGLEQRLLARLPIFRLLAFRRLKHALIDQPFFTQGGDRSLNPPGAVERLFGIKHIHGHAQGVQVLPDQIHHRIRREGPHLLQPNCFILAQICVTDLGLQRLACLNEVVAGIGPIWKCHILPMRLQIPQIDRARQNIDLRAAIIDVIFPRHLMARIGQKGGQRVPKHRAARVADMQGAGRIGRDIFHIHFLPQTHGRFAKIFARAQRRLHHTCPDGAIQPQVQKPRPGHFSALNARIFGQFSGQRIGNVARLHTGRFGQNHRRIGRHIPMGRIARRLDRNIGKIKTLGQNASGHQLIQSRDHKRADVSKQVHIVKSFRVARGLTRPGAPSTPIIASKILRGRRSRGRAPTKHHGPQAHLGQVWAIT